MWMPVRWPAFTPVEVQTARALNFFGLTSTLASIAASVFRSVQSRVPSSRRKDLIYKKQFESFDQLDRLTRTWLGESTPGRWPRLCR